MEKVTVLPKGTEIFNLSWCDLLTNEQRPRFPPFDSAATIIAPSNKAPWMIKYWLIGQGKHTMPLKGQDEERDNGSGKVDDGSDGEHDESSDGAAVADEKETKETKKRKREDEDDSISFEDIEEDFFSSQPFRKRLYNAWNLDTRVRRVMEWAATETSMRQEAIRLAALRSNQNHRSYLRSNPNAKRYKRSMNQIQSAI